MTVVFSASFVSRNDTQISKLEEENQKTLAAAEAGIEAALKSGSLQDFSGLKVPAGFTGSATVQSNSTSSFISPLLKKGDQYTFYLSAPGGSTDNPDFSRLLSPYFNQALTICSGSSDFAMSIALLKFDGSTKYTLKRFAINPSSDKKIITNGQAANGGGSCPTGQTFTYHHQLTALDMGGNDNNLLLFIKLVGTGTVPARVGISGGSTLPAQGRTIVSQAKSPTGATKIVQLFQSYPQIPAEFFVTIF